MNNFYELLYGRFRQFGRNMRDILKNQFWIAECDILMSGNKNLSAIMSNSSVFSSIRKVESR